MRLPRLRALLAPALGPAVALLGAPGGASGAAEDATVACPLQGVTVGVVRSARTERGRPSAVKRAGIVSGQLSAACADVTTFSEADLSRPARLRSVDVVALPYVACMDLRSRQVLASWVQDGGGLLGLYFPGRDDEHCRPLVGQGVGRNYLRRSHYGGPTEWADLSPAFSAEFVNDVRQTSARLRVVPSNPVAVLARRINGGPLPVMEVRHGNAVYTELVNPLGSAKPLVVYRDVTASAEPRARSGAVVGWTNAYGRGKVLYLGFPIMDWWDPFASTAYYSGAAAARNARAGTALLLGATRWAAS